MVPRPAAQVATWTGYSRNSRYEGADSDLVWNSETGQWERQEQQQSEGADSNWEWNSETGRWDWRQQQQQQHAEVPAAEEQQSDEGADPNWVWNSETDRWERRQQSDDHAEQRVDWAEMIDDEDVQENMGMVDGTPSLAAEDQHPIDGVGSEGADEESIREDDVASESSRGFPTSGASTAPSVDGARCLASFLAGVGPEFDSDFVKKHSGAADYEDLITLTYTSADLDPLVEAGMKPLHRNKLFRAIKRVQASRDAM